MRQLYGLLVSMRARCRRKRKSNSTSGFPRMCVARAPLPERSRFRSIWLGRKHRGRSPARHRQIVGRIASKKWRGAGVENVRAVRLSVTCPRISSAKE